ncbi:MAG: hypothetical protein VXX85_05005 [Candidatus Margulisiibacteriota bacterium]|nr:hypothetical protein [Candidatus Margulisiibacteriota bacterium]
MRSLIVLLNIVCFTNIVFSASYNVQGTKSIDLSMYSSNLGTREFNTGTLISSAGIEYYQATITNGNESETFSIMESGTTNGRGNFYGKYKLESGSYETLTFTTSAAIYVTSLANYDGITYTGDNEDSIASVDEITLTNPTVNALVQLGSDNDPCNYQSSFSFTDSSISFTSKFINCEVTISAADSDENINTYTSYLNGKSLVINLSFEDLFNEGGMSSMYANYIETELLNVELLHVGYLKVYYDGSFEVTDLNRQSL